MMEVSGEKLLFFPNFEYFRFLGSCCIAWDNSKKKCLILVR